LSATLAEFRQAGSDDPADVAYSDEDAALTQGRQFAARAKELGVSSRHAATAAN